VPGVVFELDVDVLEAGVGQVGGGPVAISAAVASSASRWMSAMITWAPSAMSWVAIPFPIPEAPPVTTATFPLRSGSPLIG
jgi:hypothetical protein